MEKKTTILTDIERTEWAFELVDHLLHHINKENGDGIPFAIRTKVGQEAIRIIKKNGLANFSGPFLPGATLTLTEKGKDVILAGGIKNYLDFWGSKAVNSMR